MVDISNNNIITVTRGDSWEAPLFINAGTDVCPVRYELNQQDEVYLAVMEPNQFFEEAIIKHKYNYMDININGDIIIGTDHNDTTCLKPGKYYYQVKMKLFKDIKDINRSIIITSDSQLEKSCIVTKGSIINGVIINEDKKINENIILSNEDVINKGSKIKAGSTLNGIKIESKYDVITVVDRTEFIIQE